MALPDSAHGAGAAEGRGPRPNGPPPGPEGVVTTPADAAVLPGLVSFGHMPATVVPLHGVEQHSAAAVDTVAPDAPAAEVTAPAYVGNAPDAEVVALVAGAQAGDPHAFGELYDRYVDVVHRYVYYRVGVAALAEDLVSETFLRALRRIGSFSWQGRDFAAWLITIARNLVADHFKSGRYRLEVSTADMLDADRATEGPEGEVLDGITYATLLDAVKRLNPEQQECVVLRFLQGLSVAETAQAMGKSEGAIKALQFRAVRSLGRLLPGELLW